MIAKKKDKKDFPATLPGFESINRYWDQSKQMIVAKILPGEYYVTKNSELITTVLGSCVSACIRDVVAGVGGMNHFLLPLSRGEKWSSKNEGIDLASRYGIYAMEHMINDILKHGGSRQNLEVKIFGGGKIIANMTDVGESNIRFVKNYLLVEKLKLAAQDVGGNNPRKVIYIPDTGKVMVKRIQELHNDTIVKREVEYIDSFEKDSREGEIDLFD
ncbi:MAG: chemoreceptor glutamine deamidase CheD [Gammaproteobacteria bacterium]|nr:chemoreceptor glutamine deamidase CheD [Gammaproteobacteria bacterium]